MKTKKMSLANIEGKLSKAEMKNIMAGTGTTCSTGSCSVYDGSSGTTYYGSCGWYYVGSTPWCECRTSLGFYFPSGGSSSCSS